jgi:Flp pilus assembly pilin Flp
MLSLPYRFRSDQAGATAIEYAMLTALVALATALRAEELGNDINSLLTSVGSALSSINLPAV